MRDKSDAVEPECWEVENHGCCGGVSRSGRAFSAQARSGDSIMYGGGTVAFFSEEGVMRGEGEGSWGGHQLWSLEGLDQNAAAGIGRKGERRAKKC